MWDATSEKLSLPATEGSSHLQSRSLSEVLVNRMRVLWAVCGAVYTVEVFLPPIPLSNNAAAHIHAGIYKHPRTKPVQQACRQLLHFSGWRARAHETDSHPANDRLHCFTSSSEAESAHTDARFPVVCERIACGNRTTDLVIVHMMSVIMRREFLSSMYCLALLLREADTFYVFLGVRGD